MRKFWEDSALKALLRSRQHLERGEPIEERDRLFVAFKLDQAFDLEWVRVKGLNGTGICANIVVWLVENKGWKRKAAEVALANRYGDDPARDEEAIHKAVTRLYKKRQDRRKGRKA